MLNRFFKAFQYRDFRLMWIGACTSSIGSWMQIMAQAWLVYGLSHNSAFLLGLDAFLGSIPIFLFSLVGGVMADRFDRRHVLLVSQYIQMADASILTVLVFTQTVHVWHVLLLSFISGLGQAFGGPAYQALIPTLVKKEDMPNAIAFNSIQFNVARIIGPTLGGILTDALSWNWIFYVNIVPGIISAILCAMLLRDPPKRPGGNPFDGVGLALLATGLGSLQYVLDEGERYDWLSDNNILIIAILAVASLATFVYWELRVVKNPIVDIGILARKPVVAAGCGLAMLLAFSLFGGVILAPQFQQLLLNFTATLSGLSILSRALGIMVMTFVTLGLMNRFKIRPQIFLATGFIIVAIANFQTAAVLTTNSVFGTFIFPLVFGGIGFGMIFVPLSVTVLSSVQGFDTQKATSLMNLCQQLGGSISTAVLVTLLDRRGAFHQDHLAASINLASPAVQHALQAHAPLSAVAGIVSQQAATMSFADAFFFLGVVTLVLSPLVLLLRPPKGAAAAAPAGHAIAIE